jgi:hypothetical protein
VRDITFCVPAESEMQLDIQDQCYPTSENPDAGHPLSWLELSGGNLSHLPKGSRVALCAEPKFGAAFLQAKERVRAMDVRYVEETDPLRQVLLEVYVLIILKTPYNDFDTH